MTFKDIFKNVAFYSFLTINLLGLTIQVFHTIIFDLKKNLSNIVSNDVVTINPTLVGAIDYSDGKNEDANNNKALYVENHNYNENNIYNKIDEQNTNRLKDSTKANKLEIKEIITIDCKANSNNYSKNNYEEDICENNNSINYDIKKNYNGENDLEFKLKLKENDSLSENNIPISMGLNKESKMSSSSKIKEIDPSENYEISLGSNDVLYNIDNRDIQVNNLVGRIDDHRKNKKQGNSKTIDSSKYFNELLSIDGFRLAKNNNLYNSNLNLPKIEDTKKINLDKNLKINGKSNLNFEIKTNADINSLPPNMRITLDKSNFFEFFWKTLKLKNDYIGLFFITSISDPFSIRLYRLIFMISLEISLNSIFFNENVIDSQTLAKKSGKSVSFAYLINEQFLNSLFPVLITHFLTAILQIILIIPESYEKEFNNQMINSRTDNQKIKAM